MFKISLRFFSYVLLGLFFSTFISCKDEIYQLNYLGQLSIIINSSNFCIIEMNSSLIKKDKEAFFELFHYEVKQSTTLSYSFVNANYSLTDINFIIKKSYLTVMSENEFDKTSYYRILKENSNPILLLKIEINLPGQIDIKSTKKATGINNFIFLFIILGGFILFICGCLCYFRCKMLFSPSLNLNSINDFQNYLNYHKQGQRENNPDKHKTKKKKKKKDPVNPVQSPLGLW